MNKLDYIERITKSAQKYRLKCVKSINRNKHMNNLNGNCEIDQEIIDALLTDFINNIATELCIDYGMYTSDLSNKPDNINRIK